MFVISYLRLKENRISIRGGTYANWHRILEHNKPSTKVTSLDFGRQNPRMRIVVNLSTHEIVLNDIISLL